MISLIGRWSLSGLRDGKISMVGFVQGWDVDVMKKSIRDFLCPLLLDQEYDWGGDGTIIKELLRL